MAVVVQIERTADTYQILVVDDDYSLVNIIETA